MYSTHSCTTLLLVLHTYASYIKVLMYILSLWNTILQISVFLTIIIIINTYTNIRGRGHKNWIDGWIFYKKEKKKFKKYPSIELNWKLQKLFFFFFFFDESIRIALHQCNTYQARSPYSIDSPKGCLVHHNIVNIATTLLERRIMMFGSFICIQL